MNYLVLVLIFLTRYHKGRAMPGHCGSPKDDINIQALLITLERPIKLMSRSVSPVLNQKFTLYINN